MFIMSVGTKMLAGNVRRDFRRALALAPGLNPSESKPREPRHSFVSLPGVPLEQISNWSDTAAQRSPSWCTGTSCGR